MFAELEFSMAKTIKIKEEEINVSDDYYALVKAIQQLTGVLKRKNG